MVLSWESFAKRAAACCLSNANNFPLSRLSVAHFDSRSWFSRVSASVAGVRREVSIDSRGAAGGSRGALDGS